VVLLQGYLILPSPSRRVRERVFDGNHIQHPPLNSLLSREGISIIPLPESLQACEGKSVKQCVPLSFSVSFGYIFPEDQNV
jgi:hypothetical protein